MKDTAIPAPLFIYLRSSITGKEDGSSILNVSVQANRERIVYKAQRNMRLSLRTC